MNNYPGQFIWRCARCSNHLLNIYKFRDGVHLEKKCPKCKSVNILISENGELIFRCRSEVEENKLKKEEIK